VHFIQAYNRVLRFRSHVSVVHNIHIQS